MNDQVSLQTRQTDLYQTSLWKPRRIVPTGQPHRGGAPLPALVLIWATSELQFDHGFQHQANPMDPFSLTASVIAVLQLTHKVSALCLNLHTSISARKEIGRIFDEVDALRDTLQGLARLSSTQDGPATDSINLDAINNLNGPLVKCKAELESLDAELQKVKLTNTKLGFKTISWLLKEKDVACRLERLSRARQTVQLSLAVDQT
ncbi:hypothetical protein BDV95DRAFT_106681 [Massariosphaeria phaeospora]|uniref:Fungal N-terminal domain-containing protein n=1 Tax=Massariosphaeria phaeospora TaxID=100035 RepID=A0A7C8M572_9PLEO|nr:hypothetical protein BDV95DRAFT_106681 [Massariosphaeria phaeospora]